MRVALGYAGICDACELCVVQLLNVFGATISHTCAESAKHLISYLIECTFVRNAGCNTLGNELAVVGDVALEVTVF